MTRISDETRRKVVRAHIQDGCTIASLVAEYGISGATVSKETQIRGQLKNGLAMIDFYESCDKRNRLSRYGNDYIVTLCIKL